MRKHGTGKAEMSKNWTRVVLLNLAWIAAGLRARLTPWLTPGKGAFGPLYFKGSESFRDLWAR